MTNDLPTIDFAESRRVIQRAQQRVAAGKRVGRKDRTIVQLAGLLKSANDRELARASEAPMLSVPGAKWTLPVPDVTITGILPVELLERIDKFARDIQQAALVAGNGILVGEQRALQLLLNDFRRVFKDELAKADDDGE